MVGVVEMVMEVIKICMTPTGHHVRYATASQEYLDGRISVMVLMVRSGK